MATYVMLSKLLPEALKDPADLKKIAETVSEKIKHECPNVHWKESYALMGEYDVLDVVEADSETDMEKAAMMVRSYGHAVTETMPATHWKKFVGSL